MTRSLLSVVMPVYNGAAFLAHALDSALGQSYRPIEVIAVDDGSTDSSRDVLSGYAGRINVVRQPNGGVAAARNRAIELSRGEFIAFLDQDDWWLPQKIGRQVAICQADPRIGLVHGGVAYFDHSAGDWGRRPDHKARPETIIGSCYEKLLLGNYVVNSTVMVRRSALERVGKCDLSIAGNTVQDYDLWLRVAREFEVGYDIAQTTIIRLHPAQGHNDRVAMLSEEIGVLLRRRPKAEWLASPERRQRLATLYDLLATAEFDAGQVSAARSHFREALRIHPSGRQLVRASASRLPFPVAKFGRSLWQRLRSPIRAKAFPGSANIAPPFAAVASDRQSDVVCASR